MLIDNESQFPTTWNTSQQLLEELGPLLSETATILTPASTGWDQTRSSSPRIKPQFIASVEVATEKDVQETVKYANRRNLHFLTVSGGHGWASTLTKFNGGIRINMRKLNTAETRPDGKIATVGGGMMQHEITKSLYAQGKKLAVTGLCGCVSVIGPLLGGGHSVAQGSYGFAADNLVSARVVLANSSVVVASATENADLFWALRGAGQNFGIVTSFDIKVHDASENWVMTVVTFTQDKLEAFFETWNELESEHKHTGMLVLSGLFFRNPELDPGHPAINLQILSPASNPLTPVYASAFLSLSPIFHTTVDNIEYSNLYEALGTHAESIMCRKDNNLSGFPTSFSSWDPAAMRAGFEIFSELTSDAKFAYSAYILESYGRDGVEAVPEGENAVALLERKLHILASPLLWWEGGDEEVRRVAVGYGERIREATRANNHAYLNYAVGGEALVDVYGGEERLERLRGLKRAWDPDNKFRFYVGIS
ncbi:hypothetical protein B0T14DRAFT_540508 [Immersiella caudata]|uniref:FAD-binding PCMH-type domain-containing protein n=1 Tax=Immersiella caudata TaxID=314043 RepID=A0AA39U449_9PEZI|nr:hypothetical protein B0T14DRAFT_540508 [Immersiella caudata]